ncbi:hypothetical protein [Nocardioides speluncae]|uniref:hypothetical protein n=1 Tax=Nocardioides speluncae TaxID=2670337 RepID=UPI000D698F5B|nr:hypothetical protein [Nocardioides speluncae]
MNDDTFLTDTLARGAADLTTPVDEIVSGSITAGRRIRRRRTTGAVLGGIACVAAVGAASYGVSTLLPEEKAIQESPGFATGGTPTESPSPTGLPVTPEKETPKGRAPVVLKADGWTCEVFLVDDKMWCQGPGKAAASVNWRAARERAMFVSKSTGAHTTTPMLGGTGDVFAGDMVAIGPAKGKWFITFHGVELTVPEINEVVTHVAWQRNGK